MGRLPGFDYKRPFFYMVTVKRREGAAAAPFSAIAADGRIVASAITEAFLRVIEAFHETWYCIEPIRYFVIMPDHLHLIIKVREIEKRVSLAVVVRQLIKALDRAYWAVAGAERLLQNPAGGGQGVVLHDSLRESIFAFDWHDWIVKKSGQLAAFRKYIAENGPRAAGRMLYLSPYEPRAAKLTRQEMHVRAHELVDWALAHSHAHLEAWP